jgi:hypothetical protein
MRKLFVFVIMSGVIGFVVPGCSLGSSEETTPEAQTSQLGFTRDSTGQAVPADTASLSHFTPAQGFDHTITNKSELATSEIDPQDVVCYGACDSNTCVCTGDFDCCVAGCLQCWAIVNS